MRHVVRAAAGAGLVVLLVVLADRGGAHAATFVEVCQSVTFKRDGNTLEVRCPDTTQIPGPNNPKPVVVYLRLNDCPNPSVSYNVAAARYTVLCNGRPTFLQPGR